MPKKSYNSTKVSAYVTQTSQVKSSNVFSDCLLCDGLHRLWKCESFIKKSVPDRAKFIQSKALCFNCFRTKHVARNCPSDNRCKIENCGKLHHSLLHNQERIRQDKPSDRNATSDTSTHVVNGSTDASILNSRKRVYLMIVPVNVTSSDGSHSVKTTALLDYGSNATLCKLSLMKKLKVKGKQDSFTISTVNGLHKQNGYRLHLNVKGLQESDEFMLEDVLAVESLPILSDGLPTKADIQSYRHLNGIDFPEIGNHEPELLIGADNYEALIIQDRRLGNKGQPAAVHTPLGWTLIGKDVSKVTNGMSINFANVERDVLCEQLQRMFNCDFSESDFTEEFAPSIEDTRALSIMENPICKVDGHYQMRLPWKCEEPQFPQRYKFAKKRLDYLKRKFQRDREYFDKYKEKIHEYIDNDYAKKIPEDHVPSDEKKIWYLPHHSTGEKFRLVFDCSFKVDNISLNNQVLQGPDHCSNLVGVLTRFRQEDIAFVCDIKGMFHQVKVHPDDWDSLRFLWYPNDDLSKEPEFYFMTRSLFGLTSSPSAAGYALKRAAIDNETNANIDVLNTVNNNFYVDDCLKSCDSSNCAIDTINQLDCLLSNVGFHLTKYRSNCRSVLSSISDIDKAKDSFLDLTLDKSYCSKTLGIMWNNVSDQFTVKVDIKPKPLTRRGCLSMISQIYDPLGMMQPFILPMKSLMQTLCAQDIGWDSPIPTRYEEIWQKWVNELPRLQEVSIPRCFKPPGFKTDHIELHTFCDASQVGYGAVSYLRMMSQNGVIHCSFVLGKSRVTPRKQITIPRLELCSAVLAVKLSRFVLKELEYKVNNVYYWTDSTSVLQYLSNTSARYHVFVANRVAQIHNSSSINQWRHVDTKNNPADVASRGLSPRCIDKAISWFNAPKFLWHSQEHWPKRPEVLPRIPENDPEVKTIINTNVNMEKDNVKSVLSMLMERYSDYGRLQRAIAWIIRFTKFCKAKYLHKVKFQDIGKLSVDELDYATHEILRITQRDVFSKQMKYLEMNNIEHKVPKSQLRKGQCQSLQNLCPFIEDDLMRIGGRLQHSLLPLHSKHQIILPQDHHVTRLLIKKYHEQEGHSGTLHVLAVIRERYWIIHGQSTVRSYLRKCLKCRMQRAKVGKQVMAPLPASRVTPGHPAYTWTGIDYMGPVIIKQGRSTIKRYVCVFTCMSSRAVHLEVSHSLETNSFLNALERFSSRHIMPKEIYCDNASTFVGAERELKAAIKSWNNDKLHNYMLNRGVKFIHSPPLASHQGGCWERIIRTVRKVLYALVGERVLDDEGLQTFLCIVERIINNRPITSSSDDAADSPPLTPKMLLTGQLDSSLSPGEFNRADGYRKSWKLVHRLADQFWSQWIKQYLPQLQARQKWLHPERNFKKGDLVLVVDENTKRGLWPKGIIRETFPDSNGHVRRVRVDTASSSFIRDIRKLCFLEEL
uniref:uncharacterized protein LOC120346563 n=1 Tax=Styela clava TaxID=7725 RepID=UPI00193A7B0E|nr:uncharacterized protein LOC120346563 [Styela clava]